MSADNNERTPNRNEKSKLGPPPAREASLEHVPKLGIFTKLQNKIKKATGTVDINDLPEKMQTYARDVQEYKELAVELNDALLAILQKDPNYMKHSYSDQIVECPYGATGYERLAKILPQTKYSWKNPELLQTSIAASNTCGEILREHQKKGRSKIHELRTFINSEIFQFEDAKRELIRDKRNLDRATEEALNKPDKMAKVREKEKCTKKYNASIDKIEEWMSKFPERKENHRLDIVSFLRERERFHSSMAQTCTLVKKNMVKRQE